MSGYVPDRRDLGEAAGMPAAPGVAAPIGPARDARYSRWDGTQAIPDLDADEVLDALADDMLAEGDLAEALRRLMERGWQNDDPTRPNLAGIRDLLDRLQKQRREALERYKLGDVLADYRKELDEIVGLERSGIERRLNDSNRPPATQNAEQNAGPNAEPDGEPNAAGREPEAGESSAAESSAARTSAGQPSNRDSAEGQQLRDMLRQMSSRRMEQLDALPNDFGQKLRALEEYEFLEPEAQERFQDLVEKLRGKVLDQYFQGMTDAIRGMTPEQMASTREMVRDLNKLLSEKLAGGDPDASEFLAKHGDFFPGAQNLDDIIEQLADRMAAMQSLLQSMSPEQRAELESMMEALLRDDRLRWDLAQLAGTLDQLLPGGLGDRFRFRGGEQLGLDGALDQLGRLSRMESLESQLAGVETPGDLAQVDPADVRDLLGPDAARELQALDALSKKLEEAGYLERHGDRLELTARGTRRIGQKVLDDLFARLQADAFGGHAIDRSGGGGERTETSRPYQFGEPFHLDLKETLSNALRREENAPVRRGTAPVRLNPNDFEVFQTEQLARSSTVLLVDMSRSMLLRGCYVAAKKVALALDTLIRTRFPRDDLAVVGFAYYAREIRSEALLDLSWHGYEYGTNLQHGLMLARRILGRQGGANKEIVVITDGEPTAHFEDGQVEFNYPPTRRTIQETLREVSRCTREGITINTFMLERSRSLTEFVAQMTKLNKGRAFYATPERLGEYVLVDYVTKRTERRH